MHPRCRSFITCVRGRSLTVVQAATLVHDGNRVTSWHELDLVRHQHDRLVGEESLDACVKDVVRSVVVHGRHSVVQQHQVSGRVGAAGQVDALALAAREVDAPDARPARAEATKRDKLP